LLGHVDETVGSQRAKTRVRSFIQTLSGTLDLASACRATNLRESQFHELRHAWLRQAVDLLEPRRVGRPPRSNAAGISTAEHERLIRENDELRRQLETLQQRLEIERILAARPTAPKKTALPR
jgi:hypothetical protein